MSWNETCFLSHLPIHDEDDTVVFILTPTDESNVEGPSLYHDGKYVPLSFPIRGQYDEYGGLVNIFDQDFHEKLVSEVKPYFTKSADRTEFIPYTWKSLGQFLHDISSQNIFIFDLGYRRLALAFAHTKLYERLLSHMGNRLVQNLTVSINVKDTLTICVNHALRKYQSLLESDNVPDLVFSYLLHLNPSKYAHLAKIARECIYNMSIADKELYFVDFLVWYKVMHLSRIGYCINSGCGGQDSEYAIHKIIAQFILEKCDDYEQRQAENNPDADPATILEEGIYV